MTDKTESMKCKSITMDENRSSSFPELDDAAYERLFRIEKPKHIFLFPLFIIMVLLHLNYRIYTNHPQICTVREYYSGIFHIGCESYPPEHHARPF